MLQMNRTHLNGAVLGRRFPSAFCETLDPENRWLIFSPLMPGDELEATYSPQFSTVTGPLPKPVRQASGALFIKQWLGLTDEETVEQLRKNSGRRYFLSFYVHSRKTLFDPSMMVYFRKAHPSRRETFL